MGSKQSLRICGGGGGGGGGGGVGGPPPPPHPPLMWEPLALGLLFIRIDIL
jgi:hypothetical protein